MVYRDGVEGDWTDEERWPVWRPLLGIALSLLLAASMLSRDASPVWPSEAAGRFIGGMLLYYGVPYYFALRRCRLAWKLAGFVLICPLVALLSFRAML